MSVVNDFEVVDSPLPQCPIIHTTAPKDDSTTGQTLGLLEILKEYDTSSGSWRRERIEQTFVGNNNIGKHTSVYVSVNGHLVSNPTIVIELPKGRVDKYRDTPQDLIDNVELQIGGMRVDKIYGYMFPIFWQLYDLTPTVHNNKFYIPLPIDAMVGTNAIPLLAYHEVKITVEFGGKVPNELLEDLESFGIQYTLPYFVDATIFFDYITLPKDLFLKFSKYWRQLPNPATVSSTQKFTEFTINQVEFNGADTLSYKNHKIKCNFIGSSVGFIIYFNKKINFEGLKLQFNGRDIVNEADYATYRYLNWSKLKTAPPKGDYFFIPFCNNKIQEKCNSLVPTSIIDNITLHINGIDYNVDGKKHESVEISVVSISRINTRIGEGMFGLSEESRFGTLDNFRLEIKKRSEISCEFCPERKRM